MSKQTQEALMMAIESLEKIASFTQSTNLLWWQIEARKPINACKEALNTEQVYKDTVPAPKNSLPTWSECKLIIENDEFGKRVKAGLENQVLDTKRTTPKPTELHRFIYEYDDADSYRSDWFLHRLECVIKEALEQPLLITRIACPESNIKQPEQEPVAYEKVEAWLIPRILDIHGARKTSLPKEAHDEFHGSVVWGAEVWCDLGYYVEDKNGVRHYAKPLYTHPAQLKRLSDEEINQMFDVGEAEISKLDKELARAIEKVIATKNGMELRDE